jgi:nitroimidazol reductase NimA-like FMN-containing flavoprotein (pyridoxamine 5'-phosphate oxidase superfamily)
MTTAQSQRLLAVLDEAECRRLLATASVGRVAFTEGAMPAIQPASFAVSGNDVLIPTGLGSKMAAGSRGAVLASEVDDYDLTERTGWNVTVIGPSRLISDPSHVTALNALGVLPWAPATALCYIALHMGVVRGRRISSPPGPPPRNRHG